jgi:methyl coenzyme M reductase subunit D
MRSQEGICTIQTTQTYLMHVSKICFHILPCTYYYYNEMAHRPSTSEYLQYGQLVIEKK